MKFSKAILLVGLFTLNACATPRSNGLFGIKFSDQPPRAFIRTQCNGQDFTTQGTVVCEQKTPSQAQVSLKVPPLEGRVVYSNGQMKKTEDFNWYPKEGFWIWKKKPIKDTWIDLDLGQIQGTFGDWPVALDIMAMGKSGLINTRGILYYRVCNDLDVPCSHLVVNYECSGSVKQTGEHEIGKCDRMSGSPQSFTVMLKAGLYKATPGAKLYVSAPRSNYLKPYDLSDSQIESGQIKVEIPNIESGPTLVGFRLAWYQSGVLKQVETRILITGTSPDWTGLDSPHYMNVDSNTLRFVQPVLADQMEVNLYKSGSLVKKDWTTNKTLDFDAPKKDQLACVYSWQRESSDLTAVCLDPNLNEVKVP